MRQTTTAIRFLYFVRAGIAVGWAAALATVGGSAPVATALLIGYPLLDVVASLVDARVHRGTGAATTQLANAALSAAASVAMILLGTRGLPALILVFGVWASVSGVVQLALAVHRRRRVGGQPIMILSGGLSTVAGVMYAVSAADPAFPLTMLAGYATFGAVLFVVTALRLGRPTTGSGSIGVAEVRDGVSRRAG